MLVVSISIAEGAIVVDAVAVVVVVVIVFTVVVFSFISLTGLIVGIFSYSGFTIGDKIVVSITDGCVLAAVACSVVRSMSEKKVKYS